MGVLRPDLMMKCIVPVVMAGIIAVRPVLHCSASLDFLRTVLISVSSSLPSARLLSPSISIRSPPTPRTLTARARTDLRSRRLGPHLG